MISVHTGEDFGASDDDIYRASRYIRFYNKDHKTDKKLLAKGFHKSDEEIEHWLNEGADYVLVVDRVPAEKYRNHCILEFSDLEELVLTALKYPDLKYLYNRRNLKNGTLKEKKIYIFLLEIAKENINWLCQASGIKTKEDVHNCADAYLVGENLPAFIEDIENSQKETTNFWELNKCFFIGALFGSVIFGLFEMFLNGHVNIISFLSAVALIPYVKNWKSNENYDAQ